MPLFCIRRLLTFATLAMAADARLSAQSAERTPLQRTIAEIDRHAERLLRDNCVPGAALAIVRGDRILYMRGFGTDSRGQHITGRTSFVLGSMSKSFTALAVMQLVQEKRLELDKPVRTYLPSFRLAAPDSGATVTVRHLLLHTSGIPQDAGRGTSEREKLGDHVVAMRSVKPLHPPGTAHRYGSPNYLVLGAIVEAVSGESFAAYVERAIFQPLAMRNSFTSRARAIEQGFAGGNVYAFGFPVRSSLPEEPDRLPAASLMSSVGDLSHFLMMQLRGGNVRGGALLTADLVRTMHTGGAQGDGFSYAFGWRDGMIAGTRAVHHGGIVPDFRGKMVMLPDSGWGVVVLTNASSAIPWPLTPTSHQLADDIAAYLVGRPLPTTTSWHRTFFTIAAAVMLAILAAQLRTLWREWRGSGRGIMARQPRAAWRASAFDVLFIAFVVLLPRFIGQTWSELLLGAPDVAWWLLVLAALGAATIGVRVWRDVQHHAKSQPTLLSITS